MSSDDQLDTAVWQRAWVHKVPIAFLIGAIAVTITTTADLLFGYESVIAGPPWGYALVALYLAAGGMYEWSIRREQEIERQHQQIMEALNEHNDNDV